MPFGRAQEEVRTGKHGSREEQGSLSGRGGKLPKKWAEEGGCSASAEAWRSRVSWVMPRGLGRSMAQILALAGAQVQHLKQLEVGVVD